MVAVMIRTTLCVLRDAVLLLACFAALVAVACAISIVNGRHL